MKTSLLPLGLSAACALCWLTPAPLAAAPPKPPKSSVTPMTGGEALLPGDLSFKDGLALFLRLPKTELSATEPVMADLLLFNHRPQTLFFDEYGHFLSEANCRVIIRYGQNQEEVLLTAFGKENYPKPKPRPGSLPNLFHSGGYSIDLPPGTHATYHFCLSRMFDLSRPGTYTLTMLKSVGNTAGTGAIELTSNMISFSITEPAPPYAVYTPPTQPPLPQGQGQFQLHF